MTSWAGRTPTKDEWREILEKHAAWARGESAGQRADLQRADLQGADLQGAYLQRADLQGADLRGADLQRADLRGADLRGADLQGADLQGAYLQRADLQGADLQGAYLQRADLRCADLRGADLQRADLQGAYLQGADLRGADLQRADLQRADLTDAKGGDLAIAMTRILPEGDLIGWKKCADGVLVKLRIPADAKRSHAFGRKCRAEIADVLEVIGAEFGVTDAHGPRTEYRVGQRVQPDSFDENWMEECSHGVHFFITRAEAEAYS